MERSAAKPEAAAGLKRRALRQPPRGLVALAELEIPHPSLEVHRLSVQRRRQRHGNRSPQARAEGHGDLSLRGELTWTHATKERVVKLSPTGVAPSVSSTMALGSQ